MDLLGSLGTLATNVKNVTLPSILAAAAFAILLWPPRPYDRIPTVIDNHPDIKQLQFDAKQLVDDGNASLGEYLEKQYVSACTVREGADSYKFLTIPGIADRRAMAIKNQLVLDDIDRTLLKCIEEEQALQGIEDQAITNVNALITTRVSERDGINVTYQRYVNSLSPMAGKFRYLRDEKEKDIATLQARALNFQHVQKERARRVLELQRVEKEMGLRLADAGRLRPTQKFDDVLSGLGAHIVGFLTLVFAWGLLIDPINRALFSFFYDNHFDDAWDDVRPTRQTPGQDAHDKWYGEKRYRWNAKPAVALPFVLVLLAVTGLVIFYWTPSTSVPPATATIVCASANSVTAGQSVTLRATVSVPSLLTTPTGTIQFLNDGTSLDVAIALDNGAATDETTKLSAGDHVITAQYEAEKQSSVFKASTSMPVVVSVVGGPQTAQPLYETCSAPSPDSMFLPFWPLFDKCVAVMILALFIAYFLPGLLMLFAPLPVNPAKPSDDEIQAFRESQAAPLTIDQQVARDLIETLATNLKEALDKKSADSKSSTQRSEQDLVDEQVRRLAADLASKLTPPTTVRLPRAEAPRTLKEFAQLSLKNLGIKMSVRPHPTSGEEKTDDSRKPSASEQKLAEELVKKLVEDLKKKPSDGQATPNDAQKFANDLIQQLAKDLVKNLASGPRKPLTPEQKLAKAWDKISQPPYAIGQGLMAQSDFEALQNSYYSQSLISTGLILPLLPPRPCHFAYPAVRIGRPLDLCNIGSGTGAVADYRRRSPSQVSCRTG